MSEAERILIHDEPTSELNDKATEDKNQVPEKSCCTEVLADWVTSKGPNAVDATSIGSDQKDLADGVIRKGPSGDSFDSFSKKDLEEEDKKETMHKEEIEFPVPKSAGTRPDSARMRKPPLPPKTKDALEKVKALRPAAPLPTKKVLQPPVAGRKRSNSVSGQL